MWISTLKLWISLLCLILRCSIASTPNRPILPKIYHVYNFYPFNKYSIYPHVYAPKKHPIVDNFADLSTLTRKRLQSRHLRVPIMWITQITHFEILVSRTAAELGPFSAGMEISVQDGCQFSCMDMVQTSIAPRERTNDFKILISTSVDQSGYQLES